MYCRNCGKEITDGAKFCKYCGTKMTYRGVPETPPEEDDSGSSLTVPIIAALIVLLILLGGVVFFLLKQRGIIGEPKEADVQTEAEAAEEPAAEEPAGGAAAEETTPPEEAPVQEPAAQEPEAQEPAAAAEEEPAPPQEPEPAETVSVVPSARDLGMDVPADALVYNGHSYYLFDNSRVTWEDVVAYCHSRGGYPTVIESREENDLLFAYMLDMGYECSFIGYTDHETEGHWKWVDGKTSDFTDWGVNREGDHEPNSDTDKEDFCQLDLSMVTGTWNDCDFGWDTVSFICEWDAVN